MSDPRLQNTEAIIREGFEYLGQMFDSAMDSLFGNTPKPKQSRQFRGWRKHSGCRCGCPHCRGNCPIAKTK